MKSNGKNHIKIAILDLYEGQPNQGMRCIRDIIKSYGETHGINIEWKEFEVRNELNVPDTSFDVYISSGGPGIPLDSEGSEWERKYFNWLDSIEAWNNDAAKPHKKFVFFICHSFQLVCRQIGLAKVSKRKSTAFGVFPIHLLHSGRTEPVFDGLQDPFYVVDSRDYQVISPDPVRMKELGAKMLCIEKDRPHVPLERAVMAIRFNEYMIGTQFHPEADAVGMSMYLQREDKKQSVIENHGEAKWASMIEQLNDPDKILWTYAHILPNFLSQAIEQFQLVEA
ncbi:MAG: GMP synthase [Bacteroidetes bacterium]|nr:MAG: GMP synthase [Bacteroidota bacterium]